MVKMLLSVFMTFTFAIVLVPIEYWHHHEDEMHDQHEEEESCAVCKFSFGAFTEAPSLVLEPSPKTFFVFDFNLNESTIPVAILAHSGLAPPLSV
jgi:hypothetical protein